MNSRTNAARSGDGLSRDTDEDVARPFVDIFEDLVNDTGSSNDMMRFSSVSGYVGDAQLARIGHASACSIHRGSAPSKSHHSYSPNAS
jgi:hypothetical protein